MVEKLKTANVLCAGDLMLDRFVQGDVSRISPEAPVPVFRRTSERVMLGGVGNVVANLRALGVSASVACRVGDDADGAAARRLVEESGAEMLAVVSETVPTIQKTRFVARGHHVMRMDREVVAPLTPAEEDGLLGRIVERLPQTGVVVLSDYAKGVASRAFCERLIAACRAAGRPVYVDPKGSDYSRYAGATLVKPNRSELEAACGVRFDPSAPDFLDRVVAGARMLLEECSVENAVVTLSERGMVYVGRGGGGPVYLPTEGREVSDVSGAGDTTMAVLAAMRAAGAGFREAMEAANAAAGVVVGKVGTAVVSPAELESALSRGRGGAMPFEGKIYTRGALAAKRAEWKAQGLTVGFTNGCFDCLHCGHLSSLFQAKEHCDRLVVAVNSDESVRRLKGPSRPIQDERTRTLVLAGLETVDAVVVFGEDTALPVVEELMPDVIAKEGYAPENWPEAGFVVAHGGRAVTLRRVDGYSTTATAERMAAGNGGGR